jgi:hypothetical protein
MMSPPGISQSRMNYIGFDRAAEPRHRGIPRKEARLEPLRAPVGEDSPGALTCVAMEHDRQRLGFRHSVHPGVERCFPTQRKVFFCGSDRSLRDGLGAREMNQVSFVVLIALGLALTGYFGVTAWRLSSEDHTAVTGTVFPKHR